jgi:hypothetical protein
VFFSSNFVLATHDTQDSSGDNFFLCVSAYTSNLFKPISKLADIVVEMLWLCKVSVFGLGYLGSDGSGFFFAGESGPFNCFGFFFPVFIPELGGMITIYFKRPKNYRFNCTI